MKEATGEANMTVVTIILIAAVVAIAAPIMNTMLSSTSDKTDCLNRGCVWDNGTCKYATGEVCDAPTNSSTPTNSSK